LLEEEGGKSMRAGQASRASEEIKQRGDGKMRQDAGKRKTTRDEGEPR
jgi:hypothetical protein